MKLVVKYSLIFVLAFFSLGFQQSFDPVAKQKATYLYQFTKYFDWPNDMKTGNFVIQLVGTDNNMSSALNNLVSIKQTVLGRKLEIRNSSTLDASDAPQILFILKNESDKLKEALSKFKGKGSLIVGEKPGLAEAGAAISFIAVDEKLKFEYSKNNAVKAKLKTNEELKNLAHKLID